MLDRNSKQKPPLLKKEEPAELSASDTEAEPPKASVKPSVKPKPKPVQKVETPAKSVVIHTQQKKKTQKPKK